MLHCFLREKANCPRNLGVSGVCFTCTDSQRGTEIVLVDHMIETFSPAQEGTCGEVKGVKKKGGKGFFFSVSCAKGEYPAQATGALL